MILVFILGIVAYARHFFNLRHRGIVDYKILVTAFAAFLALATWLGFESFSPSARGGAEETSQVSAVDDAVAFDIIDRHCRVRHSVSPTHPGFVAPPAGVLMDDPDVYRNSASQMLVAIRTGYMPLGNVTGMNQAEKDQVIGWLEQEMRDGGVD